MQKNDDLKVLKTTDEVLTGERAKLSTEMSAKDVAALKSTPLAFVVVLSYASMFSPTGGRALQRKTLKET